MKKATLSVFIFTCFFTISLFGEIPYGYYNSASGLTGTNLRTALHNIIDDHNHLGYNTAKEKMFGYIDNENGQVQGVYTGEYYSVPYGGMPDQNVFNCEHTWPKSWFDYDYIPKADLHHLFPTFQTVNSSRSSYPFDWVDDNSATEYGSSSYYSEKGPNDENKTCWEPADDHKGDLARAMFYFATRYEDYINEESQDYHGYYVDMVETFLEWHAMDPVSQKEIDRNDAIYSYQYNRNPFVDHPEYVNEIWGDPTNVDPPTEGIIITEVACNPSGSYRNEYIELYNASNENIDISGMNLNIERSNSSQVNVTLGSTGTKYGSTNLEPGEFYIVTRGTIAYNDRTEYSGLYLNRSLYVELKSGSTVLDRAASSSSRFSPSTNYELQDINADNSQISAWTDMQSNYSGTPGQLYNYNPTPITLIDEGFENSIPSDWTVYNNDNDYYDWSTYTTSSAHSGNDLASIRYNRYGNDDWLITPKLDLTGDATVSFYARSYSGNYKEDFNVKLSTSGKYTSNFNVTLDQVRSVGTGWQKFTYNLDNYTGQNVYIAIQCVSRDKWYLYIDDFEVVVNGGRVDNTENEIAEIVSLEQNYPNPYRISNDSRGRGTTIKYTLNKASKVELKIYNIKGQLVKNLINEKKQAGLNDISWFGKNNQNQLVKTGVYFYKLKTGDNIITKKLILIK